MVMSYCSKTKIKNTNIKIKIQGSKSQKNWNVQNRTQQVGLLCDQTKKRFKDRSILT